jgi:anti-anti-sigma factor
MTTFGKPVISTSIHDRVAVIRVKGRFDDLASAAFRESSRNITAAAGPEQIEVDLGEVDYIDSTALGCLLLLRDGARMNGKTVVLVGINGTVAPVLSMANFSRLFAYR